MVKLPKNELVIIGGAEKKKGNRKIIDFIVNKIDKKKENILIFTVASEISDLIAKDYLKVFDELEVKSVVLKIEKREDSNKEKNLELIRKSKVIFFTGGDQLRITSMIGGTKIYDELNISKNKILVGTSAGASVMSDTMIVGGIDEESPKKKVIRVSPGLSFLKNIVIDPHFAQRGRIGRLLTIVSENPGVIGIGIDEDTAIFVKENKLEVLGSGAIYIIDGSDITYTNPSKRDLENTISIFNIKLHVLTEGNMYKLDSKEPFEEGIDKK